MMQPRIHTQDLQTLQRELPAPTTPLWIVDVPRQRLGMWRKERWVAGARISTSRFGLGNTPDSQHTPLGWHRITEVIGRHAPLGQPFVSRKPSGEPLTTFTGGQGDAILTRILPLEGLVPGLNHHSRERNIYIHGTHQEELLGIPASHGCIRTPNAFLARSANAIGIDLPFVWIGEAPFSFGPILSAPPVGANQNACPMTPIP